MYLIIITIFVCIFVFVCDVWRTLWMGNILIVPPFCAILKVLFEEILVWLQHDCILAAVYYLFFFLVDRDLLLPSRRILGFWRQPNMTRKCFSTTGLCLNYFIYRYVYITVELNIQLLAILELHNYFHLLSDARVFSLLVELSI